MNLYYNYTTRVLSIVRIRRQTLKLSVPEAFDNRPDSDLQGSCKMLIKNLLYTSLKCISGP
jgi:hypothetical protein